MTNQEGEQTLSSLGKSELLQEIFEVSHRFYRNNPRFTTLKPPKAKDLGFRKVEGAETPKTKSEAILKEMAAVVPMATISLFEYTHNPNHLNTFFKIGLVYANDPHTYIAVPAQKAVDSYRNAFVEYLPHRKWEMDVVSISNPNGLPKGRLVDYLPLHSTIWCFLEEDGNIYPIDALTLFTGKGYLATLFTAENEAEQPKENEKKEQLRLDILTVMNEYTHVSAVGMYHLYEDYFLPYLIATIEANRERFGLSDKWSAEKIRENFSLIKKGIRRYINIGYDPGAAEYDPKHHHLLQGSRDVKGNARGPQSADSAHFFSREIPYKKFWRLYDKSIIETFLNDFAVTSHFTVEEYRQLDLLVHEILHQSPAWSPPDDVQLFDFVPRSQFIAEDTDRFIKALDPFANWESPALLEAMIDPLQSILQPLGLESIKTLSEQAESMQPYHRNISALTMKFPNNKVKPAEVMVRIGDVLAELYEAKKTVYQPDDTEKYQYVLLSESKLEVWQDKMRAYAPTRKQIDPFIDRSYSLNDDPELLIAQMEESWSDKDCVALFRQLIAQYFLYHWNDITQLTTSDATTDLDTAIHSIIELKFMSNDTKIDKKWQFLTIAYAHSEHFKQMITRSFSILIPLVRQGEVGEEKMAQYLVARTLENNRLGIIPKGQRTLNTTRLPGFLLSYDYINEGNGIPEYLQFMISPIISERSSVEQNKGITVPRAVDEVNIKANDSAS